MTAAPWSEVTAVPAEIAWVQSLAPDVVIRFLARLSCGITIAGRDCYEAGTDDLINPRRLRRVNEVQHRVTACLSQLLEGTCPDGFVQAIGEQVLTGEDDDLRAMLQWAWLDARKYIEAR